MKSFISSITPSKEQRSSVYRSIRGYSNIIKNQVSIENNYNTQRENYLNEKRKEDDKLKTISENNIENTQKNYKELFNKNDIKKLKTKKFDIIYPLETDPEINNSASNCDFFADDTYYSISYLENLTQEYNKESIKNININKNLNVNIKHNFYTGIRYKKDRTGNGEEEQNDVEELYNLFLMCFLDIYYNSETYITKFRSVKYNNDSEQSDALLLKLNNRIKCNGLKTESYIYILKENFDQDTYDNNFKNKIIYVEIIINKSTYYKINITGSLLNDFKKEVISFYTYTRMSKETYFEEKFDNFINAGLVSETYVEKFLNSTDYTTYYANILLAISLFTSFILVCFTGVTFGSSGIAGIIISFMSIVLYNRILNNDLKEYYLNVFKMIEPILSNMSIYNLIIKNNKINNKIVFIDKNKVNLINDKIVELKNIILQKLPNECIIYLYMSYKRIKKIYDIKSSKNIIQNQIEREFKRRSLNSSFFSSNLLRNRGVSRSIERFFFKQTIYFNILTKLNILNSEMISLNMIFLTQLSLSNNTQFKSTFKQSTVYKKLIGMNNKSIENRKILNSLKKSNNA